MSTRSHFWYYLTDAEGHPVNNANINVYLASSNDKASIYLSETGGSPTTNTIKTDESGFFEFWISGYNGDEASYSSGQKFKITWDAESITSGGIDNIDFISNISIASIFRKNDIEKEDWELDNNIYKINITHNLDTYYPIVVCYDYETSRQLQVSVESVNEFEVNIYCNTAQNSCVTIIG